MPIRVLETLNWPGAGLTPNDTKLIGDDRFGFDETAGTAWVLDGATDVGPMRLFNKEESDAAWVAEALNRELSEGRSGGDIRTYFATVLAGVRTRAERDAVEDLETAPRECLPIASGMWVQVSGTEAHFAFLGDCEALVISPYGPVHRVRPQEAEDRETTSSRTLNALSAEEKLAGLCEIRALQNTVPERAVFGLSHHAVSNLRIASHPVSDETHILLMTDGLWRLVEPYGEMTAQQLADEAVAGGIEALAKTLRAFEGNGGQDVAARIKKSDDACAVLLRTLA